MGRLAARPHRQHLDERDRRLLGPGFWTLLIGNLALGFVLPFVVVAHLGGLLAGVVIAPAVGFARHPVARVGEGLWLLGFAAVCGIGWGVRW